MYYKADFNIDTFQFWGGAKSRMKDATYDQRSAVADRIEELFSYDDNIPTDTDINDLVWFECDDIFYPEEEFEEEEEEEEE